MPSALKWWGYVHKNGAIAVKRYFNDEDLKAARESDLVTMVINPFFAVGRDDAYDRIDEIMDKARIEAFCEEELLEDEPIMDRDRAVEIIEALFPADSQWPDTAKIGRELLEQAKRDCNNWRAESTNVLIRYAQLCMDLEKE